MFPFLNLHDAVYQNVFASDDLQHNLLYEVHRNSV